MKKILLFDTIIDGHHADYLTHLITYWLDYQPADELIVVAQPSFGPVFERLCAAKPDARYSLQFVAIPPQAIEKVHQSSALTRSFREWNLCQDYVGKYKPTHTLLMYFDLFQLAIWLGKRALGPVSGIYFRPDFHYGTPVSAKARFTVWRKRETLHGMLRQRAVKNLFCLDHSAVPALQQLSRRVRVLPLPDPVESYAIPTAEIDQLRRQLQIGAGRQVFLLFGHLDERKGIEPLLAALKQVDPAVRSAICLLLVGSIRPDYRQKIEAQMAAISPDIQIIPVFGEVKGRLIQAYFDLADYALALYQRHVGMASVIVRAAVSGKPLLSSDYGYMGRVVQTNQLGAVTDSTDPVAIGRLFERVLTQGISYSEANLRALADANSDTAFARTIFDQL